MRTTSFRELIGKHRGVDPTVPSSVVQEWYSVDPEVAKAMTDRGVTAADVRHLQIRDSTKIEILHRMMTDAEIVDLVARYEGFAPGARGLVARLRAPEMVRVRTDGHGVVQVCARYSWYDVADCVFHEVERALRCDMSVDTCRQRQIDYLVKRLS